MSITLDWIKISVPNLMERYNTAMRRCSRDQKSKPEVNSRDVIKWTNKHKFVDLSDQCIYFNQIWHRAQIIIIIITKTMFMALSSWQSHCESSPGSFDECRTTPNGRRPKTKPDDLGCGSACTGCQNLHPPSPFIITQPEIWYSFYRPTEGKKLSRSSWLVTYRDGLPVHRRSPILVLTGSDIAQLHWSRLTRYH